MNTSRKSAIQKKDINSSAITVTAQKDDTESVHTKENKKLPLHTPEPWFLNKKEDILRFVLSKEGLIAETFNENDEANSMRIVACINACAGISTEALEHGVINGLKVYLKELLMEVEECDDGHSHSFANQKFSRDVLAKADGK